MTTTPGAIELKRKIEAAGTAISESVGMTASFMTALINEKATLQSVPDKGQNAVERVTETLRLLKDALAHLGRVNADLGLPNIELHGAHEGTEGPAEGQRSAWTDSKRPTLSLVRDSD